jgi:hypothetical protein
MDFIDDVDGRSELPDPVDSQDGAVDSAIACTG